MAEDASVRRGFERHAAITMLGTIVSRLFGLAREAVFGRLVGLSDAASAFSFAFMVPNLFRRLFGEGALSSALVPELAQLEQSDPAIAERLASITLARVTAFLAGVVIVAEVLVLLLPTADEANQLGLRLLAITLPYVPLICLAALGAAVLQVRGRFGIASMLPILLNIVLISSIFAAWLMGEGPVGEERITVVAQGVIVAGVAQAAWAMLFVYRTRGRLRRTLETDREAEVAFRRVGRRVLPLVFGLGVLQLNTFLDGLIASWPTTVGDSIFGHPYPLDETAMATLTYAARLYEFPLGVFGIAVATAIFPQLSREADDGNAFLATLQRGIRLAFFIGLPASVGIVLVRHSFAAVVYQGFAFDAADVDAVASVLLAYAVAIWSYSLTHVLVRAFYARNEAMASVKIGIAVVMLNLVLNLAFVFGTGLGVAGLAWSTAICSLVQTALLGIVLGRRTGGLVSPALRTSLLRTFAATLVMGGVVWVVWRIFPKDDTWSWQLLTLLTLVGCGGVVYVAIAAIQRRPELAWAIGRDRA